MPTECKPKPLQRELADSIIKRADLDDLRILVATGAKINEQVTKGLRPIHYAAYERYLEAVQFLLVRGCDINSTDDLGYSALHLAAEHGYLDMMELLLSHGAKTDYRKDEGQLFPRTTLCDEPLRLAIKNNHYEAARMLLEHGANANARYFFGAELNLLSVTDVEYMDLLLTYGADPDSKDRTGLTMLMKACRHPQAMESVLCLISHGANVNAITDERHDFRTVLHYAVLSGNLETVTLLLRQGASVNTSEYQKPTAMDLAILRGDPSLVTILIAAGADVNASSPIIGSPLHVACADNIPNRVAILKILLESGADVNRVILSEDGTALKSILGEYISSNEDVENVVVRLLLQYGSRVIFKSQFRDPAGILNYLTNVCGNEDLMMELLESAESFDPPMIKRCSALSPEHKRLALSLARNPKSLKHQVRLFLRLFFGPTLPNVVHDLGLPKVLQSYLQFYAS